MLNALSTAMFTLAPRRAIETDTAPTGLLRLPAFLVCPGARGTLQRAGTTVVVARALARLAICRVRRWCVNSRRNLMISQ